MIPMNEKKKKDLLKINYFNIVQIDCEFVK